VTREAEPGSAAGPPARREGRLSGWNDARGFGFLKPVEGGPDAFAHVREFASDDRLIEEGRLYSYEEVRRKSGRVRARDIRPVRATVVPHPWWKTFLRRAPGVLVIPAFAGLVIAIAMRVDVSPVWWIVYGLSSLACFIGYRLDKRAAQRKEWRVSETILLLVGLVGGWPGAILAQEIFHHKTKKPVFRKLFWMSVGINMAAFVQINVFNAA